MSTLRTAVTGGAGFIGSHLVDYLMSKGHYVKVFDNFSAGKIENIRQWMSHERFELYKVDLKDRNAVFEKLKDVDVVFHLAANPEVRLGSQDPYAIYSDNVEVTFNVLEAMRLNGIKYIVFTSSSTVCGETNVRPTPEDYSPMEPISVYGASKLACEALIMGYAHTFNIKALILRLANIVGPRAQHGVIYDFIHKLLADPTQLEILGDGSQRKSYLYISDCIEAIYHLFMEFTKSNTLIEVYNIGSQDWITVKEIADIVVEEMGLKGVKYRFTGGVEGGRGWRGDVKYMLLDVSKALEKGWRPKHTSQEAVRLAARALIKEVGKC